MTETRETVHKNQVTNSLDWEDGSTVNEISFLPNRYAESE